MSVATRYVSFFTDYLFLIGIIVIFASSKPNTNKQESNKTMKHIVTYREIGRIYTRKVIVK